MELGGDASFDNPFDRAFDRWTDRVMSLRSIPELAGLSERERALLGSCVGLWVGMGDPYRQGYGQCWFASYMIRRFLEAAGVEADPVTMVARVSVSGVVGVAEVGSRRPRSFKGGAFWSGHEVVWIPGWELLVDPTIFQARNRCDAFSSFGFEPAIGHCVGGAVRVGSVLSGVSAADTGVADADAALAAVDVQYEVVRPDFSYRGVRGWDQQQAELDRAVQNGLSVLGRHGLV